MKKILVAVGLIFPLSALAQGSLLDLGKNVLQQHINQPPSAERSTSGGTGLGAALSGSDITAGLKEALRTGSEAVISRLGRADGFNLDKAVHIPLPGSLQSVQSALKMTGMSGLADDLELKMNRAAEAAAPQARALFVKAVESMSVEDARGILNGPQDSATRYFQRSMTPDLKQSMRPIIDQTMAQAGVMGAMDRMTSGVRGLPMVGDPKSLITDHVLDGALNGVFHYLAQEEAAIRNNPAKRTTDILRTVFGK